ncbi:MAG: DNA (cytosine-5-)-methyltransferase [Methanobrevibacter millerae]|uniref:DNA (Cytosine-5-)-methyltransferase n=1 Tax=Methanobrevibacter millerae TaxID=230361 RepID=A0A8T3VE66_9EURY|nr:DNA (cytosine-5-)-methyltransferase [Methanobrevibacter millerae]MBE6505472.1 DNA (cytosine-5-)-methyltransferase [Methanobrevibacter millerae]
MDKTVVELFAGVGGFRCGFNEVTFNGNEVAEKPNWDFVWANQWEPSTKTQAAFDCYCERFGESDNHVCKDIHEITTNEMDRIPEHTLLVGGFPCQDYSVARSLSNEKGIEGKKGVLWWDIASVIEARTPPFVLLENVDRLLRSPSTQRGRDFAIMLRTFLDNGYAVEWRVINAAEYGFPQRRRRVFIFAYHKSTNYYKEMCKVPAEQLIYTKGIFALNFPITNDILDKGKKNISEDNFEDVVDISDNFKEFHFFNAGCMINGDVYTYKVEPNYSGEYKTLGDVLEDNVDEKYIISPEKLEKWKYLKGSKKLERKKPNGETYCYSEGAIAFPDHLDVPARTMLTSESTTNRSSHIIGVDEDNDIYRTLTPVEAERIQMFPDNWTNVESKAMTERRRYFMMGNALVVGIVQKLGNYLEKIVDQED